MSILVGGAPSTGSSLLVRMLHRHPALFAGPETFLFIHRKLYVQWHRYRSCLWRRCRLAGLKSEGWFRFNGVRLLSPAFGHDLHGLRRLVQTSDAFPAFAHAFFARAMERKGARWWVEKTPSNVLCFAAFRRHFPQGRVIHITRHPLDAMASLVARGHHPAWAVAAWLVNTALGMRTHGQPWQFTLRYEDLVVEPERVLADLCVGLALPFSPLMLEPDGQGSRMPGWQHDAAGPVRPGSVGRFAHLVPELQQHILQAVRGMRIAKAFADWHGIGFCDVPRLAAALHYELPPLPEPSARLARRLQRALWRDRLGRLLRLYPTARRYPVCLRW